MNTRLPRSLAAFLILLTLVCASAGAATLNVPTPQYPNIQSAITAAGYGDTVLVGYGNYSGPGNVDLDFLGKTITVRSLHGAASTFIDCQGSSANPHRAFYFHNGETSSATVDGFTIKNGYAPNEAGTTIGFGSGIYIYHSSPTITNCNFIANAVNYVGAGLSLNTGSPTVTYCTFRGNGTSGSGEGGGIYSFNGSPTIADCVFTQNQASVGGGIAFEMTNGSVTNCVFSSNSASQLGAAMLVDDGSAPAVTNCTFNGNVAHGPSTVGGQGGALASYNGSATLTNCILYGDSADANGNEISVTSGTSPVLTYSDVAGGYLGTGNITADPIFVNAGTGNLHLQPGSPCIGAGTASAPSFPTTDLDGNVRVNPPSIGAYDGSPPHAVLTISPSTVVGNNTALGTVTLNSPAPSGGDTFALSSSSANATVPAGVTVPAGATSATFMITTSNSSAISSGPTYSYQPADVTATITASDSQISTAATLTIDHYPYLTSIAVSAYQVVGGNAITGIVTIDTPAPPEGYGVLLSINPTNNPDGATVSPNPVTIPAGATSATFTVNTNLTSSTTNISIAADPATLEGNNYFYPHEVTTSLTITPLSIYFVTVYPNPIVGGTSSQGSIGLNAPALAGGAVITLSSDSTAASVPASVTIPAGSQGATFPITTTPVTGNATTVVHITASYNNSIRTAPLYVDPPQAMSVSLNPTSVTGGSSSSGTVTLTGAAPAGGSAVSLFASSGSATVPSSVTVPAGATSAMFPIATSPVASSTSVSISAQLNSAAASATLTVNPSGAGLVADAYVQDGSNANTNFGTAPTLRVKTDNSGGPGYNRDTYLKFDLTGVSASSVGTAKLRFYGGLSAAGSVNASVYAVPTATWSEAGITWNNRPTLGGSLGSVTVNGTANAYYEVDVTSYVQAQTSAGQNVASLALHTGGNSSLLLSANSREAGVNPPQLVITPPVATVTVSPTADAYVQDGASANTNFGAATILRVKTDSVTGYNRDSYVKFDLSNISSVSSAKLKIYGRLSASSTVTTTVYSIADNSWTETGITWNARPALGNALGSVTIAGTTPAYYTVDVTNYVQAQKSAGSSSISLALHDPGNTSVLITANAREAGTNTPQLVITP